MPALRWALQGVGYSHLSAQFTLLPVQACLQTLIKIATTARLELEENMMHILSDPQQIHQTLHPKTKDSRQS